MKEQVFLPFAALEYGRPCCLEGDPMDDIEPVKKSFFNISENITTSHEITHGVTGNSANLVYQGESGALNRCIAFSLRSAFVDPSRRRYANFLN